MAARGVCETWTRPANSKLSQLTQADLNRFSAVFMIVGRYRPLWLLYIGAAFGSFICFSKGALILFEPVERVRSPRQKHQSMPVWSSQ